jgi:dolichol-phosphate mannosyltransferase
MDYSKKGLPEDFSTDDSWELPSADIFQLGPRLNSYAVAIPVINEGERLRSQLAEMKEKGLTEKADILIFDGGSNDGSTDLDYLGSQGVRTLLVKKGPGRLSAQLRMGFAYALTQGYEGIITIDGNGKDGVEAIPNFIRELRAGYDFVQGSRYIPGGQGINTPRIRDLAIRWIHAPLISLGAGFRYSDTTNAYRGHSRQFLLSPAVRPFRDVFNRYELLFYLSIRAPRTGHRVKEIPVIRRYPGQGQVPTKISHIRGNWDLIIMTLKVVLGKYNP